MMWMIGRLLRSYERMVFHTPYTSLLVHSPAALIIQVPPQSQQRLTVVSYPRFNHLHVILVTRSCWPRQLVHGKQQFRNQKPSLLLLPLPKLTKLNHLQNLYVLSQLQSSHWSGRFEKNQVPTKAKCLSHQCHRHHTLTTQVQRFL